MGLTMVDRNEPVLKLDPLSTWWIPESWTLAEASSVPLVYAHVSRIVKKIFLLKFLKDLFWCVLEVDLTEDMPP